MFRSTFFGIEIGKRALMASRAGTDIVGHNLSNSGRPEYSRQTPNITASNPYSAPGLSPYGQAGQLGTGAQVNSINRAQDELLARQIRSVVSSQARLSVLDDAYTQIEAIFAEPSEVSVEQLVTDFFATWHDLSLNPEESSTRTALREIATTLSSELNRIDGILKQQREELNNRVDSLVRRVNDIGGELADLNNRIQRVMGTGQMPNDLMDRRDDLIMQLSEIVEVKVHLQEDESAIVTIGGRVFVQEDQLRGLAMVANPLNEGYWDVVYADLPNVTIPVTNGELLAVLEARDEVAPEFNEKLDTLAESLITEVNALHVQGFGLDGLDGRDFFEGTDAESIALTQAVRTNHLSIAAAQQADAPGDPRNAVAIAQLRTTSLLDLGDLSYESYYRATISDLGASADGIDRTLRGQDQLLTQLGNMHESETGVNMDEELVNLIRFEQAYSAASRVITTIDETLDRLINGTGRVGL